MHDASIKNAGPTDAALGRRIRALRLAKGVSLSVLASRLGIAVQQVQKYEKGTSRVGVGRLIAIAAALRLPLTALLQPLEQARGPHDRDPIARLSNGQAVRLAKAFLRLSNKARASRPNPR